MIFGKTGRVSLDSDDVVDLSVDHLGPAAGFGDDVFDILQVFLVLAKLNNHFAIPSVRVSARIETVTGSIY